VGNIGVGWVGDDPTREVLDLVEHVTLQDAKLAAARDAAQALEAHAYINVPARFGPTLLMSVRSA
jgi:hypothetical protein